MKELVQKSMERREHLASRYQSPSPRKSPRVGTKSSPSRSQNASREADASCKEAETSRICRSLDFGLATETPGTLPVESSSSIEKGIDTTSSCKYLSTSFLSKVMHLFFSFDMLAITLK